MLHKSVLMALAGAALIPAAALAQHGPPSGGGGLGNAGGFGAGGPMGMGNAGSMGAGGGMGMGAGMNGGIGGMNGMGGMNSMGVSTRDAARMNSQALSHASPTGIAHANQNSVLAGTGMTTTVTSGALTGLTTGTTLYSNGTAVGTVQQIRTTGRGSVAMVVIKGTNGGYYALPANKLSYSGGTLSTSARLAGINGSTTTTTTTATANSRSRANSQGPMHASATGIAHANAHSVLYGASTGTALSGVSVGMPFFSNGTQVGTVYRVVTANGRIQRVLVQSTNGRIYSLAPNTLTASGGSVTTTTTLRGI
jgi:hypothetical protein